MLSLLYHGLLVVLWSQHSLPPFRLARSFDLDQNTCRSVSFIQGLKGIVGTVMSYALNKW